MKILWTLFVTFLILTSCMTEKKYFMSSLTDADKLAIQKNDSLIKEFYGKTTWGSGDYFKGNLLIKKSNKSLDIRKIGEWKEVTKDGKYVTGIAHYDNFGNYRDEKIYAYSDTPQVETTCINEITGNKVIQRCETVWKYYDTGTIRLESKSLGVEGRFYKHGTWKYYSKSGELEKTEEYRMNKRVR